VVRSRTSNSGVLGSASPGGRIACLRVPKRLRHDAQAAR
jgi:hypothetical protein